MAKQNKRLSSDGINLLMILEGERLIPYNDKTGDKITEYIPSATIGIGHLILKKEWNQYKNGIPSEVAKRLLKSDLSRFEDAVNNGITININQNKFDALVIFAFNIGVKSFLNSSALKLVNNPAAKTNYSNLESAWKAWNKDGDKIINGLIKRRAIEWEFFLMPEGM